MEVSRPWHASPRSSSIHPPTCECARRPQGTNGWTRETNARLSLLKLIFSDNLTCSIHCLKLLRRLRRLRQFARSCNRSSSDSQRRLVRRRRLTGSWSRLTTVSSARRGHRVHSAALRRLNELRHSPARGPRLKSESPSKSLSRLPDH